MNFNIDDVIVFNDGEYLILDVIRENNNTYLYLINNDEFLDDVSIVKVNNNNNVIISPFLISLFLNALANVLNIKSPQHYRQLLEFFW